VTTQTGPATIPSLGDPVNACHDHRGTVDVDRKRAVDDNGEHLVVGGVSRSAIEFTDSTPLVLERVVVSSRRVDINVIQFIP
jgi:hypothetical protein